MKPRDYNFRYVSVSPFDKNARQKKKSAGEKVPVSLRTAVEIITAGVYPPGTAVDWDDFLDRIEVYAGIDLGSDVNSSLNKYLRAYCNELRKNGL